MAEEEIYRVIFEPVIEQQLEEIVDYLCENVSFEVAEKVHAGLWKAMNSLHFMPTGHSIVHDISNEKITYRRILKWSYKIIFTIDEDEKEVIVVYLTHEKRDPQHLIDGFGE